MYSADYPYTQDRLKLTPGLLSNHQNNSTKSNQVEAPCAAYLQMQPNWEVIDAVKSGTRGLRDQGNTFLPTQPFEKPQAYNRRLARSCYAPWYVRLRDAVVGQILRKPITFEAVSARTESHLDNINLLGDDVNSFVRSVLQDAIDEGHAAVFVDYPKAEGIRTLAEQVLAGVRPYWIHYSAKDIIGWRSVIRGDQQILTQLRIKERHQVPEGEFGEVLMERIKVFDLIEVERGSRCQYRIFQKNEQTESYEVVEDGFLSAPTIPVAIVYTGRTGFMTSEPPMLEIAYLNIKHYQLSSDLDHSLNLAANPKLCLFGYDTTTGDIDVGVDEALVFDNPQGRAEWIAAPVHSFEAQERRIKEIEQQMSALAISAMTAQKNVGESAEAKRLDRVQSDSILSVLAQSLQDALDYCLQFHAGYLNEQPGESAVNRDFQVARLTPEEINSYAQLQQMSQISLQTFLELLQQGEILPDEFNIEEEIERIAQGDAGEKVLDESEQEISDESNITNTRGVAGAREDKAEGLEPGDRVRQL